MPTITISKRIRDEVVAHARDGAPEEVCGLLAGGDNDAGRRVEAAHPARNASASPRTNYELDPAEQLELMESIEDAGRDVVGFYHSHPKGPQGPSATDAAEATWPDQSYVIVSLGGDGAGTSEVSLDSWRWTGEEFVREEVRVVDSVTDE